MNQFIKLHLGLVKFLQQELPKKQTFKERVDFLKVITGAYFKEVFRLFKSIFLIFDKTYREQKAKFDNIQNIKTDLNKAVKILKYIDDKMKKAGVPSWKRKQFWRDFYKNGAIRQEVFDELVKDINQIK